MSEQNTAEVQKIVDVTKEEHEEIVQVHGQYQEILLEAGQLFLEKLVNELRVKDIETRGTELIAKYGEVQKKEGVWSEQIVQKYGRGTFDIQTGKIALL